MNLPIPHTASIQPVIKEQLIARTFKRQHNQVTFNRQVLPVPDFTAHLNMKLYNLTQVRVVTMQDVALIVIIKYRYLPATTDF
ncbi:MAG: hypothetical protein ACLTWD_09575 [Bacteroides uniformis]